MSVLLPIAVGTGCASRHSLLLLYYTMLQPLLLCCCVLLCAAVTHDTLQVHVDTNVLLCTSDGFSPFRFHDAPAPRAQSLLGDADFL